MLVLASQVAAASGGASSGRLLVYVIAVGVGLFVGLALLRVVRGVRMVTTGVLTAPVVLALALGLSSVLAERSSGADGFGLLGFASAVLVEDHGSSPPPAGGASPVAAV